MSSAGNPNARGNRDIALLFFVERGRVKRCESTGMSLLFLSVVVAGRRRSSSVQDPSLKAGGRERRKDAPFFVVVVFLVVVVFFIVVVVVASERRKRSLHQLSTLPDSFASAHFSWSSLPFSRVSSQSYPPCPPALYPSPRHLHQSTQSQEPTSCPPALLPGRTPRP
jgi:hypothetical protein